jgi:two-component system, cell cycle sensor histidine kinase and response regulator CckA
LRRHGYMVLEARHGIEALTVVQAYVGRLHLVLTDVIMPQLSGREVAEAIADIDPSIKILYMSGYTDDAVLRHGIVSDAVNFIHKPYTADALLQTVRQVLDGTLIHADVG